MRVDRRNFLKTSAAFAASAVIPGIASADELGEDAASPASQTSGPMLRVKLREADNSQIDLERFRTCHARDIANDPLPLAIHSDHRTAAISLGKEPVQIAARLKVPDFGEVYCV